jgi:hypothetical protein
MRINPPAVTSSSQQPATASGPPGYHLPGAWTQDPSGNWNWNPNATPDPTLASQWGNNALTNPAISPDGNANHGAWEYNSRSSGWGWVWGATPPDQPQKIQGSTFTPAQLTDPTNYPNGAPVMPGTVPGVNDVPTNPPPPDDVVPPALGDSWGGVAPQVTGTLPPDPSGSTPGSASQPPSHPPYLVSPGDIRTAEGEIIAQTDTAIRQYDDTKAFVQQTASGNIYSSGMSPDQLKNIQDKLLQDIADVHELVGNFTEGLNWAAQNYAHAEYGSVLPET